MDENQESKSAYLLDTMPSSLQINHLTIYKDINKLIEISRLLLKTSFLKMRACSSDSNAGARIRDGFRNRIFKPSNLLVSYRLEDLFAYDTNGWAPIHYCAFLDYRHCIRIMINEVPLLIDFPTSDGLNSTPLLLSAMSGNLNTVMLFVTLGANMEVSNTLNHNIVSLCTFKQFVNILNYLISLNHPNLPVWSLLVKGLNAESETECLAAAKTLRKMTDVSPPQIVHYNWIPANENKICNAIFNVVTREFCDNVKEETYHVFLNIANPLAVKYSSVKECNAIHILIDLLKMENEMLFTLNVIALHELVLIDEYTEIAYQNQIFENLVIAFSRVTSLDAILVCTKLLSDLLENRPMFQNVFTKCDGIGLEVVNRFKTCNSKMLANALLKMARNAMKNHFANQILLDKSGLGRHLIKLSKAKNRKLMLIALAAIRSMAKDNPETQASLIYLGAVWPIVSILKKSRFLSVQEQSAKTLWMLGGVNIEERLKIYEAIGLSIITEFIDSGSKFLNFIGSDGVVVMAKSPLIVHEWLYTLGTLNALTNLLLRTCDETTVILTIQAIKYSCFKAAYIKFPKNQKSCMSTAVAGGTADLLVQMLIKNKFPNEMLVKAQCAVALGAIALGNPDTTAYILTNKNFNWCQIILLLKCEDEDIRALAGEALALLCYNQPKVQIELCNYEGIYYERFFKSMKTFRSEMNACHMAFSIVVLARVFPDSKSAWPASEGLVKLYLLLKLPKSSNVIMQGQMNAVITQALNYICAMLHSRSGIPEAYISLNIVDQLATLVASPYEQIRALAAITLGYLSFHSAARRGMMSKLRMDIYLLEVLIAYTADYKLSPRILDDWKYYKLLGLPSFDLSRGLLIRPRVLQIMDEGRPYTMTGIEDPASGVIGAITVEKDDDDDEITYTDDPPVAKKKEILEKEEEEGEGDTKDTSVKKLTCLAKLELERYKMANQHIVKFTEFHKREDEDFCINMDDNNEEEDMQEMGVDKVTSIRLSDSIDIFTYTY